MKNNTKHIKRLPQSVRKYIRAQKAKIRANFPDQELQQQNINLLKEKFSPKK